MKNLFYCLLITILNGTPFFAQDYRPFIVEGNYWLSSDFYQDSNIDLGSEYGRALIMLGDTIVNDTIYNIIVDADLDDPSNYKGLIREDSTGKVFVRELLSSAQIFNLPSNSLCPDYTIGEEILYYDFGMEVGEQRDYCVYQIEITSIDSVFINGNIHRRLNMTHNMVLGGTDSWIEGIGSMQGFQGFFTYEFENNAALLCFKNDSITYINPEPGYPQMGYEINENCDILNSIKEFPNTDLKIYPNPVSGLLQVDYPYSLKQEISISNIFGQVIYHQIKTGEITQIEVEDFPLGIYLLSISHAGKNIGVRKFIKN
ncbi:MAG: hypothetical protein ACI85O_001514 [Saprospiraceae bacterium]|jgi:hypothetical protein